MLSPLRRTGSHWLRRGCAACLCLAFAAVTPLVWSADHVALVIGNSRYDDRLPAGEGPNLLNPGRDAGAFAQQLRATGFEVLETHDATARDMVRSLNRFAEQANGAKLAVFYYAGHGIEIGKEGSAPRNHLLPVDAILEAPGDEQLETLGVHTILSTMEEAGIHLKVVILDCCRNNPYVSRSWLRGRSAGRSTGGLAEVPESEIPEGTLIVFSGAPGMTVPDGQGNHSPFTAALLSEWRGGRNLPGIVAGVAERVSASEPWIKFDGSGRTFAAFHSYQLAGSAGPSAVSAASETMASAPTSVSPKPLPKPAATNARISEVRASSQLEPQSTRAEGRILYAPGNVSDGDVATAWVEGARGNGEGEFVEVEFRSEVMLSAVSVFSGYGKNRDIYTKNGRPETIKLTTDGGESFTLRFADRFEFHRFTLPAATPVRTLRFEIRTVHPGAKYEDTAISEILFE